MPDRFDRGYLYWPVSSTAQVPDTPVSGNPVIDYSGIKTTRNRKYNPEYISYIDKSLIAGGLSPEKRATILANIIEESGGDPFALDGTGKFYGLLQWSDDRYKKTGEKDIWKELDNQVRYILESEHNTTDHKSWTHGGPGTGYNSYKDAVAAYNSEALDDAMKGFTLGYVRPTGKMTSYNNRLKVAKQLYDLKGFRPFDAGGFIQKYGADKVAAALYKDGGKIRIRPENKGKFTALLKRTGKSASWFKEHGTPLQKKRATFALNARKWKHADGGLMHRFDGEEEPTGYMVRGMWSPPSPSAESVSFPYALENTSVSVPVEEPVVTTPSIVMPKRMGEAELLAQVKPATIQRDRFRNFVPDERMTRDMTPYELDLSSAPVTIPKRDTASYFTASASKLLEDATKFDPAGLSRDEVLALQRDMANNGYYSEQLNGMSKDEIKSIQTKLIKRGLLSGRKNSDGSFAEADGIVGNRTRSAWNEYNVDGRWGKRSDEAYKVKRKMATQAGDKRWEQDFREGVDGCARWVTQKFESVLGEVSGQNGVYGNAWQMPKNIVRKGGTMLFNLYDEGFDGIKSTSDLKKRTKAKLSSSAPDLSVLQPGDIVGIFFPRSTHHDDVLKEGTTYNTHVGMIVSYDSDGTPIVQHNMGGNERKDRADKLPWGSQITVAARPQTSGALDTYPWQMGKSRYEVELPEKFERLATDESRANLQTFMDSMAGGADVIGKIYNNADMDAVQRIAVGVLGRETGFMQNTESSRTGKAGARVKAEKLLRSVLHDENPETKSSDLSKFKLSNLSPNERAFLGIQSASDLEKPEKAGLASMYVLAKNYDYFVRYAKENPQLGLTPQDIEDLTALSYNQGMGRLYSVGATEFEGKLRVTPSKIQAIREAAASDETIDDFKATKLGRIAHEYPMLTNVMKELYNKGLGGRSSSYMNAARQAISNIKRKQN